MSINFGIGISAGMQNILVFMRFINKRINAPFVVSVTQIYSGELFIKLKLKADSRKQIWWWYKNRTFLSKWER